VRQKEECLNDEHWEAKPLTKPADKMKTSLSQDLFRINVTSCEGFKVNLDK
jgi:hypothetical protein